MTHRTLLVVAIMAGFTVAAAAESALLSRRIPAASDGRPTEWQREQTILDVMRMLRTSVGVPIVWEEAPGPHIRLTTAYDLTNADVHTALNGIVIIDSQVLMARG